MGRLPYAPSALARGKSRGWRVDIYAERFHYIRRAAFGGHAAIAVLGHADASAGHDQRTCSGDIERTAGVSASAAGIDQRVTLSVADVHCRVAGNFERCGRGADGLCETDDLFDRLALHVQGHEQCGDLGVRAAAGEDFRHDLTRLLAGERLTVVGDAVEGVEDHGWL